MTDKKLKPFDLEKALAGEPVVTRSGIPVQEIHYFKNRKNFKVTYIVPCDYSMQQELIAADDKGNSCSNGREYDLFMAPKTIICWTNVYKRNSGEIYLTPFKSEKDALLNKYVIDTYIKTISFEIEE